MAPVLLIAAAAVTQLSPPELINGGSGFGVYPERALERGQEGAVLFSVSLDPQGNPLLCNIEHVYGDRFGSLVCQWALKARYRPARDSDGKPAYGFIRSMWRFSLPETPEKDRPPSRGPDLSLNVKIVPGLLEKPKTISVAVAITADGTVADCASMARKKELPLAKAACAHLKSEWTDAPLSDSRGGKQRYVRLLQVAFVPEMPVF